MPARPKRELIDVYLVEPGQGRPPFSFEPGALEHLPPDAPLPLAGDVILLSRSVTGDSEEQAFAWAGTVTPFLVLQREHVYVRESDEEFDPLHPKPARYVRTMICVRRLTHEEYRADPGPAAR